jgi:hypothetical protein
MSMFFYFPCLDFLFLIFFSVLRRRIRAFFRYSGGQSTYTCAFGLERGNAMTDAFGVYLYIHVRGYFTVVAVTLDYGRERSTYRK